jgi:hypothetical protein
MAIDLGQVDCDKQVPVNWGRELLAQKGGWTAGELGIDLTETKGSVFTKEDFEGALKKVSRKIKK